jgi:hypothetical protein
MHGMDWGDEHGAQGYGFHSNFYLSPAIVFPCKSQDRRSNVVHPAEAKMVDTEFCDCLGLWSF